MPIPIDKNSFYTTTDMKKLFGFSRQEITNLVKKGRLPKEKIGNKFIWRGDVILHSLATPATMKPDFVATTK